MIEELEKNGVIFKDKNNVYIDNEVIIGRGTIIYPNVSIRGKCIIGENNTIDTNTVISESNIGSNNKIGPMVHIHTNSDIGSNNVIGNFVEVKNSIIKDNIKAKHLSYIGDTYINNSCNIGAGVIFANCNGFNCSKEKTLVKENTFIGSNSVLIAPLEIGSNSLVAAGSVITDSINDYSLAIARNRQTTKDGYLNKRKA